MTNPAVVILTDPAGCQLAEAETLLQALLQVQQLNTAGVPASQAFCDHPAAAMDFIEAYSRVYPELQLQTSDLPLPQHLYAMLADGRLSPLRPAETPEAAKLEQAGQPHPLYVLSLGAPDALMQALQHNNLAKSSIRILEIAPIEQAMAEPVPVAEAVAAAPLPRSSWSTESSRSPDRVDEDVSVTEQLTENPVQLSSLEVDLDRIHLDKVKDHQDYDHTDRMQGELAPAVLGNSIASPGPHPANIGGPMSAEAPAGSVGVPAAPSQPAAPGTLSSEAVLDALPASAADGSETSIIQSEAPPAAAEPPSGHFAQESGEQARNNVEAPAPPSGEPGEQDPTTIDDAPPRPPSADAQSEPDVDDAAATNSTTTEVDDEGPPTGYRCVFDMPGEDVVYQPTGSFSANEDIAYALPTDDGGEPGFLNPLFSLWENAEVIDPEAIYRDLSEPGAEDGAALKVSDFILLRAPNSERADPSDAPASCSDEASATQLNPEPDEDGALNNPLTTFHDADV